MLGQRRSEAASAPTIRPLTCAYTTCQHIRLAARSVRDEEAGSSNLPTPTQVRGPFPVMRGGPSVFRAPLVHQDAFDRLLWTSPALLRT